MRKYKLIKQDVQSVHSFNPNVMMAKEKKIIKNQKQLFFDSKKRVLSWPQVLMCALVVVVQVVKYLVQ